MPELPEVETIRRGLDGWVIGRRITDVEVRHPRAVRRHHAGPADFRARLLGTTITGTRRRGKFLWLPLDSGDALLCHLGMSGQLLIEPPDKPDGPHLRIRLVFDQAEHQLRFVDQRTFGEMLVSPDGAELPGEIAHIAPDIYDPAFDLAEFSRRLRARRGEVKRALLDQSLISGVGNIYADEALWRARLHGNHPSQELSDAVARELVEHIREVFDAALNAGGTSFDALYVNTNGESGYFDRSLAVYGRAEEPCRRCGTPVERIKFTNRSSFHCPSCQIVPG
ncbi:bifunctional DNA-formamidopyrimidine glycosylase/DNA-(apurinic or apyrimidinic site) lyase [Stackebrandtia nassauensis]|uniref:Formamidopyrimidine-DNA glycosylase n=1 Tax=Stackebrandtia nassauensis (strain DSM 44728 / CIP 108903 / NRRL B-16338 / NBRC 102104 / LLR-40K-21) TaxID=446470 RepID=D3PUP9_STANL|nr:bifunctional DNA-formamidopyrimidine glycosylase/DNA-(apurinic or apyrimidinic site) lyase [Stackebrandtia nassauensis]ADD44923.1 formamidopyrimidine-DNA glycosylase [Stackebrandtia nassauensis DSM 44728]